MSCGEGAECLSGLTSAFYERNHRSFSDSRQAPWQGWSELWRLASPALASLDCPLVADVACGNLRFARFLQQNRKKPFRVIGFDGCEPLLREGLAACEAAGFDAGAAQGHLVDIAAALQTGSDPFEAAGSEPWSLSAAFGFLHHLPEKAQRARLLDLMVRHGAPGGLVVASFWQFGSDERLRAKAEAATQRALAEGRVSGLAPGDYVLGWQGDCRDLRFCHHFAEDEIDGLSASLAGAAEEVARFSADGKSGQLNRYVVWRRHG